MDLNKLKVAQFIRTKHHCVNCGSLNIIISKREVLNKLTDVYLCIDCNNFYMDINQIQNMQYQAIKGKT